MAFEAFVKEYGAPKAGTSISLEELQLSHSAGLKLFASHVGGGVFAKGFISLVSVREKVSNLGGWEVWLPKGSRLFGCSAFGTLFTTTGNDAWITDTQYGEIVESDDTMEDFIDVLASPSARDDVLQKPFFDRWSSVAGELPPDSVLCPVPALPLGGSLSVDKLTTMSLPVYLSFTGQLFSPQGGMPATVRPANR